MTSEQNEEGEQRGQGEPITERGVERHVERSQGYLHVSETSAYCIGYIDPRRYAEALARAGGDTTAVEPDEAWETEDAVSRAEAEQLALARWREWQELGVTVTLYERIGYREFPHPDPDLAAAGVTDCAWDDTRAIATVNAGQFVPFV